MRKLALTLLGVSVFAAGFGYAWVVHAPETAAPTAPVPPPPNITFELGKPNMVELQQLPEEVQSVSVGDRVPRAYVHAVRQAGLDVYVPATGNGDGFVFDRQEENPPQALRDDLRDVGMWNVDTDWEKNVEGLANEGSVSVAMVDAGIGGVTYAPVGVWSHDKKLLSWGYIPRPIGIYDRSAWRKYFENVSDRFGRHQSSWAIGEGRDFAENHDLYIID